MAAIKRIYLEKSKFDREYVHPFIREVDYGDTIEFVAVDGTFTIAIHNFDDFLKDTSGNDPGESLVVTLVHDGTSTQQYKIASTVDVPYKSYDVIWNGIYADRPGNSPPRIIIAP